MFSTDYYFLSHFLECSNYSSGSQVEQATPSGTNRYFITVLWVLMANGIRNILSHPSTSFSPLPAPGFLRSCFKHAQKDKAWLRQTHNMVWATEIACGCSLSSVFVVVNLGMTKQRNVKCPTEPHRRGTRGTHQILRIHTTLSQIVVFLCFLTLLLLSEEKEAFGSTRLHNFLCEIAVELLPCLVWRSGWWL